MSFDTTNGTRGARQPKGPLLKWMNSVMSWRISRKGKAPGMPFDALVLVTVGAKSGEERRVPLGWFPSPDGGWLVVAAAAGAPKNPAWYYNLAAHPDRVSVEIPRGSVPVTAGQLHGAEREQAWQQIVSAAPQFAKYQAKTDRELPVIRLVEKTTA
jgi:deazaflavin-dependent oxidoreductase (nitroreductase family)